MKWTNTFSALLVMMTMTFAFTSCDEDPWDDGWDYYDYSQGWYDDYDWYDDAFDYGNNTLKQEAQALRGYWTGKVENRYYDQQNQLQRVQMDAEFEFDLYNSNALNGRGRETDYAPMIDDYGNYVYDDNGQLVYDSQQLRFSWYIDPRSGDICIKYDGSGYDKVNEQAKTWLTKRANYVYSNLTKYDLGEAIIYEGEGEDINQPDRIDMAQVLVEPVDVYTLKGIRIRTQVPYIRSTEGLMPGIYVVKGRKVLVK